MIKKNVLFVTDKWCAANPTLGLTNHFHNVFNTFEHTQPNYNYNIIHFDESLLIYNQHIDGVLQSYCQHYKPDIIILIILGEGYDNALGSNINPTIPCLNKLKDQGIYLIYLWPDTGKIWGLESIKVYDQCSNLHISWDSPHSKYHDQYIHNDKYMSLWTPEDDTLYYLTNDKNIQVSFLASVAGYEDRIAFLNTVNKTNIEVFISGGQRQIGLSSKMYAQIVRQSKIGINFPSNITKSFYQAKGRIFEYTACGGLLMDYNNPSTNDFFEPHKEYVPYDNIQDLLDKIQYYLNHEEERLEIATNGYNRFQENWTCKHWWDKIITRIESEIT